jgi:hypothetical protein
MPTQIKWKTKILLVKVEATYGTDPVPTAAANAILAKNVSYSPMEGEDVSRDLEFPYLAAQGMIPTGLRAKLEFDTEYQGSGIAGTKPPWGVLMRASGCSETVTGGVSTVYAPITDAMESATAYFWLGGTQQVITGMRGSFELRLNAQSVPIIHWTLIGLYAAPAEVARVTPTLTSWKKPLIATNVNTPVFSIGASNVVLRNYSFNIGNAVEPRLLIGREEIFIPDRAESISAQIEALPTSAAFNPYSSAQNQTPVAVNLTHGTAAGSIIALNAPTCQVKRPTSITQGQNIAEWPLGFVPLATSGNDQWTMTLT